MTPQGARPPLVLTRPAEQARAWAERLQQLGVPTRQRPLIAIEADAAGAAEAWRALPQSHGAFLASPAAVAALAEHAPQGPEGGSPWPAAVQAACVGPGTAAALRALGAQSVCAPPPQAQQFDSEALWPLLQAQAPLAGQRWLWLRGDGGRDWLLEQLRAAGAQVQPITVYHRRAPAVEPAQLRAELRGPGLWLFSSSEAIDQLEALVPDADWPQVQALATHPRIAARARRLGLAVREVAPQLEAVAAAWREGAAP